jgi:hypothetical protein
MLNEQIAARHSALILAVELYKGTEDGAVDIMEAAVLFLAFLSGADVVVEAPVAAKPAAPVSPAKPAKPAAVAKPVAKSEPEVEADEAPTVTDKEVAEALGAMLAGNKREEAVALMGKFGATSKSTLDKKFYAAFVAQANKILLTA